MRKLTRKGLVRALDEEVRRLTKLKGNKCVCCGTTQNMTCGHLITRAKYSVRWDLQNCWPQCASCNLRHEYDPHLMTSWFIDWCGLDAYKALVKRSNKVSRKSDKELKELLEELKLIKNNV